MFGGRRARGAAEEVSLAGDPPSGADEPEQLRDGVAALPERGRTAAAAEDLEGFCVADASQFDQGVGRAWWLEARRPSERKHRPIRCGLEEVFV